MIAFVISLNGQRVATIGVGDSGVLSAIVSWSGRAGGPGALGLDIGGLDALTDEHIRWPHPPEIKVGDTITIQVLETDTVDAPTDRKTPAQLREEELALLTEMEAEHQARLGQETDKELPPWEPE